MKKYVYLITTLVFCMVKSASAFDIKQQNSGSPIQIDASEGIECDQEKQKCIAKGDIMALQGDTHLTCDQLVAYFKKDVEGKQSIYQLEAIGHVHIWSTEEPREVFADYGHYDVDKQFVTLRGEKITLNADKSVLSTSGTATFDQKSLIAKTNARSFLSQEDRTVQADTLEAHFKENKQGETVLSFVRGDGSVVVSTPQDIITGDKGDYNAETEVAHMYNNITITRQDTQITGDKGEFNLKTGQSKMLSFPESQGKKRSQVSILIKPQPKKTA